MSSNLVAQSRVLLYPEKENCILMQVRERTIGNRFGEV